MASEYKHIDLTPYSAKAVMDEYGVMAEETVLRAAVQTVYNFMSGEPRFNAQDRADNNRSAAEESILFLENRLPVLRVFEEDFFEGRAYDKDAVTVAAVCGKIIDRADDEYNAAFSKNLDLLDPSLADRANDIFGKAKNYLEHGLRTDEPPTLEALFIAQLEAIDVLKSAIFDYNKGSVGLDYLTEFQNDMFRVLPSFLTQNTGLHRELYDTAVEVYDLCHPAPTAAQILQLRPQGPS